jgi:hypothetical protein
MPIKNGQDTRKTAILAGHGLPPRGVEPLGDNSQQSFNKELTKTEDPVLSTSLDNLMQIYPDLAELVKAWPDLPDHDKQAIMKRVRSHLEGNINE